VLISQGKIEYFTFKCPIRERKVATQPVIQTKSKANVKAKTVEEEKVPSNRPRTVLVIVAIVLSVVFLFQFIAAYTDHRATSTMGRVSWQQTASLYKTAIAFDTLCAEYHLTLQILTLLILYHRYLLLSSMFRRQKLILKLQYSTVQLSLGIILNWVIFI